MSDKMIDWATVLDICGEEDMVEELIEATVADGSETMALLQEAVQTRELKKIELYAHRLKGVSMIMGAATLTPLACALEDAAHEGRLDDTSDLFVPVQETFDKVSSFLSQDNWVEMAKQLDSCQA